MAISKRLNKVGRTVGYSVVVSVPNPRGGRGTRHVVGTYRLRRDAEAAERTAKDAIARGTFDPKPKEAPMVVTVADVVNEWFADRQRTIQPNSANGYATAMTKHLLPALGTVPIDDLTHDMVQQTVNGWRDDKKGAQTIARCVLVLRSALTRQVRRGKLPFNPAEGIEKPQVKKRRDVSIWSPEQMDTFLRESESDVLFPFWHLCLLEGMRRSEALGLRWRDLTWNDGESGATATIRQTVIPDLASGGRPLVVARTKTDRSARVVTLTHETVAALKLHRDRQRFKRQGLGESWGSDDLIVTNEVGEVVRPDRVKQLRKRLMERAGVPLLTTHDLRHSAATVALAAGTSPTIVAAKLGHSEISTTVDVYGHITPSDQAAANDAVSSYLARAAKRATGTENPEPTL